MAYGIRFIRLANAESLKCILPHCCPASGRTPTVQSIFTNYERQALICQKDGLTYLPFVLMSSLGCTRASLFV